MRTLVVNAGSRSVKLRVVEDGEALLATDLGPPGDDLMDRLAEFTAGAGNVDAVGHRVVHGGASFTGAVAISDQVRDELGALCDLAPLHNPPALVGIDAARRLLPRVPSVACFDTAFHAGLPVEASSYAVPAEWVRRWGIRRYGFHGLSCSWSLRRVAQLLGRPAGNLRLAVCHLGGGASVTAVAGGRSVDTTMGFTPLEGLVMATRSGDLDPGALLWVIDHGLLARSASDDLEHRAGLLGLSGGRSSDMREVLAARNAGDREAEIAIGVYLHRLRAKIAAMAAASEGLDALVFTGGVGENSAVIRIETCAGLGWLGVRIAETANDEAGEADCDISSQDALVRTMVIHAREELQVAAECQQLLEK